MPVTETTRKIIADLRDRLHEAGLQPELRLFGAHARGADEADLDLCLVFAEVDATLIESVHALTWSVGFDHGVTICPLVISRAELDHPTALMQQIRSAGVVL